MTRARLYFTLPFSLLTGALVLSSCTNQRIQALFQNVEEQQQNENPTAYKISNVTVGKESSDSTKSAFSVFFDSTAVPASLTQSCTTASGNTLSSKPCLCQFSWQQVNPFSTSSSPVPRLVFTNVTSVTSFTVKCAAPDIYSKDTEIPVGTVLKIRVIPAPSSPATLVTTEYKFKKPNSSGGGGSFQDEQGRYFDDILRYTCYEQFKRGTSIKTKKAPVTGGPENEQVDVPLATQFCVSKVGAAVGGGDGCTDNPVIENSAQAYYYNLYTRESEVGGINYANNRYVCPKVKEPLISALGPGHHWPLDSSFALSLGPTSDFPVGVESFSKISNGAGDTPSQGSSCYPTGNTEPAPGDNQSLVRSCLGFAAKPNADGTCPYFKDSTDHIRQTYRLRRFIALYPPVFDSNGEPVSQAQATDTIYVLDRPVLFPAADTSNKPFTMRGPKPCPFAFFDHKGVLGTPAAEYPDGVKPVYAGTNRSEWKGKNVDGIQLPNTDSVNSCAAALPLFNDDMSILSIATVHKANPVYKELYIRPVRPWAPHYVEDTEFLACAPQSNEMRDPPLHFAKDPTTGNVSWCAEAYPTQNDNVASLDKRPDTNSAYYGKVQPFTSHVVKNSMSADCEFNSANITRPATYPGEAVGAACPAGVGPQPIGLANHPADLVIDTKTGVGGVQENVCAKKTCDRTVANQSLTWAKFPLLAPPDDVEKTLMSDTTYGCVMTYDNGGGKTGTKTPSEGCCGGLSVLLRTGVPAADETDTKYTNTAAHLEPDLSCAAPKY